MSQEADISAIRRQVLDALEHPEAEEGLYLENFFHLHEEDERHRVNATEIEILDSLKLLIEEGKVLADESGEAVVFKLAR